MCVYLDVTHLPRELLDRKLAGMLEIYEKFQGADPRTTAMKIFPAVHYSMGGLWCDYEANAERRTGRSARRATSRRTSPARSPSASATTSSTGRTGWGPIRWWPACSAG